MYSPLFLFNFNFKHKYYEIGFQLNTLMQLWRDHKFTEQRVYFDNIDYHPRHTL